MRISRQVHVVSLEGARAIISAGRTEAARRGWAVAIAVVEPSGDLIAFEMMDGTQPASQGAGAPGGSATVQLSSAATALLEGAEGGFDAEKVKRVRDAIADGTYKINPEAIADKLIANAQELLGKRSGSA